MDDIGVKDRPQAQDVFQQRRQEQNAGEKSDRSAAEDAGKAGTEHKNNSVSVSAVDANAIAATKAQTMKTGDLERPVETKESQDVTSLLSATGETREKVEVNEAKVQAAMDEIERASVERPAELLSSQGEGLTNEKVLRLLQ